MNAACADGVAGCARTHARRGVCWNKKNKRWQAALNSGGKYIYLGSFKEEMTAARIFDRAAIKLRGTKAKLNFTYAGEYTALHHPLAWCLVSACILRGRGGGGVFGEQGAGVCLNGSVNGAQPCAMAGLVLDAASGWRAFT